MVVLQHKIYYFLFTITTCVTLSTVQGISNKLQEIANTYYNRESLVPIIERHLERVDDASPIHIIIDLKVDSITLNSLLMKYMEVRSSYLWNSEELIPEYVKSCTLVYRVVGIYSDISYVRPLDQREFFGDLWRPRAKLAIWITNFIMPVIIQTVLEKFWSIDSINIEVIMTNYKYNNIYRFTYNPFIIDNHRRGKLITPLKCDQFFSDKYKNLYGYQIPISLYHSPPSVELIHYTNLDGAQGSGVEVLRYFASWMNFTIVLKSSPLPLSNYTQYLPSKKYYNGIIGPVGDIIKGRSEILGNAQILDFASDFDLEFIYPLKNVQFQIVIPVVIKLSSIAKIFHYIDIIPEILILLSTGIFSIYVFIIYKRNLLITYFQLLFQMHIRLISHKMSERLFFFTFLIFAYIISSVHQSHIMQSLTDRTIAYNIPTSSDIRNSDLKIILDYTYFKALKRQNYFQSDELIRRTEINPNFYDCITRLGKGERVACAGNGPIVKSGMDTLQKEMLIKKIKFNTKLRVLKTNKFSLSAMIVRRGFPYLNKFNVGYFNIYSFGLIRKWRNTHVNYLKSSNEFNGPLRLSQFQGIFSLFIIFIIISMITFICELTIYHIKISM